MLSLGYNFVQADPPNISAIEGPYLPSVAVREAEIVNNSIVSN
jgi:hypothetical protein